MKKNPKIHWRAFEGFIEQIFSFVGLRGSNFQGTVCHPWKGVLWIGGHGTGLDQPFGQDRSIASLTIYKQISS